MSFIAAANAITVERRSTDERAVVAVRGEVDLATAPELRSAVDAALDSSYGDLCLDLCGTTFMDSSGLHVLFDSHARAEALQRRLTIVCPSGAVRRLLDVTGYAERFHLVDDLAPAHG